MRGVSFAPLVVLGALAWATAGCGRTALDQTHPPESDAGAMDRPLDLPSDRMDAPREMAPDLPVEHPPDLPPDRPPPPPDAPVCVPKTEVCNGVDDDCDGLVDEDQPPIPCPNGGVRQCVGGAYSACPVRCTICVPGSKRTCITSFCTFWGNQECAADGMSFGRCVEAMPPPECAGVASKMQRSPELEQCCISNGYCCVDEFDLNNNGDRTEMLGSCGAIVCE